jgi:hypothetical protein
MNTSIESGRDPRSVATLTTALMAVVVSAVVKSVFAAYLSDCLEGAFKVPPDNRFRIFSLDTEHHFDTVVRKDIHGTWPHASRQDDSRALLAQPRREYSATVLRWGAETGITD